MRSSDLTVRRPSLRRTMRSPSGMAWPPSNPCSWTTRAPSSQDDALKSLPPHSGRFVAGPGFRPDRRRQRLDWQLLHVAVYGYAGAVAAVCVTIQFLVDRVWLGTLVGFGPRW